MSIYDKNISAEKKASLEFAEQQREEEWKHPSFALQAFHGKMDWKLIHPFPAQTKDDKEKGDAYIEKMRNFLVENLDPDEVDRTGEIPDKVVKGLAKLKAFALKVPEEYGGLEFSQYNYNRIMAMISSYCGSTAVLLSAHQSIGVPQPLKLFGTKEQKEKYFPMFAEGKISAFALTEQEAGSDPRNMSTTATPTQDGKHYIINGEKLWCTNGLIADVIVVMAVTPPKIIKGKERKQITAFIVETNSKGFEIVHRCQFMGLNGIQNGLVRLNDVKVPKENMILAEGQGLKLALTTLNTGRLTIPAASVGISKWCLNVARLWSKKRVQWGTSIGQHESIGLKLGYIAAHTYAMDAMTWLTSAMADDKKKDIRLEAAIAKYFCTEHTSQIVDETLQIRGGSGYETSKSLRERGVDFWPVERVLRDARINRIIEGTSEIMHLFIAREALDPYLSKIKPLFSPKVGIGAKLGMIGGMLKGYLKLYFISSGADVKIDGRLKKHAAFMERTSRRLGRIIFHNMVRYQKKLEPKQAILNRIVDIGTLLFAMASVLTYTDHLIKQGQEKDNALDLADLYCRIAKEKITALMNVKRAKINDRKVKISKKILGDQYEWLENDIVK